MKNLLSALLITTLAVASSLAAAETPQGGVQAPLSNEDGALWEKKHHHHKCKDSDGPCNFACDRVAVAGCVSNAGSTYFDACSDVFSCQTRCENEFGPGAQDPCGEVCASSDCKQRCINLKQSGGLTSSDDDACEDVCGDCFQSGARMPAPTAQ
ncbi:hypothetical protein MVEG_01394 [Podila verticillata NRRL 6337]|nr:hypothetical protein MVEG_01394 [Podila verticillata NRRL 6337]